eukprot:g151.t1
MDQKDVANLNADLTTCWPSTSGDYALRDVLELPHDFVAGRDGVLPPNLPVALAAATHLRAHLFTDEELPPPIVSEESAVVISSDDAMSDLCFVLGGQWFLQAFDPDTFEPEILLPTDQHAHAGMDNGFTFSAPVSAAAASTAATSATSSDELFEDHGSASGVSASHHQHQGPKYINTDYYPPPTEDTDGHAGGGDFSTLLPVTGPRPPREDERAKPGGRVRNKHYPAAAAYVCDLSWLAQFPVAPVTERYGSLAFFDDKKRLLAFYNFEAARLIKRPSLSKRRASLSDDDALRRAAVWDRAKFHFRSTLYVHLLLQNLTNLLRTPNVALSLRRFLPSFHPLLTALKPVLLHTERTNRSVLALFSTGILQAVLGFGDRVFSEVVARFLQLGAHSTRHGASLPERVAWKFGLGAKNGSKLPVHGEDGTAPESYSIDENRSLPSAPFFHPQLVCEDVELSSLPLVTDGLELYSILDDHVGRLLSGILFGGADPGPNKRAPGAAESAEPVDPQCVALEEFLAFVKLHHPALLASSSDDDRLGDSASKGKKGAVRPLDRVALARKLRLVLTETVWNCCAGFQDLSYLTEHADHMEQLEEMNEGRASTAVVPNGVQAELNASNTLMADKEHFVLNLSLAAIMSQAEQPTLLQEAEAEAASGARRVAAGAASPGGVAAGGEDILGIFTPKLKVDLKKLASRVTSRNTRRSVRCPLFDPRVLKRGVRMDF